MTSKFNIVADACPDANGNTTVRVADGTEHGDTARQPIATVYNSDIADEMVTAFNAHHPLLTECIKQRAWLQHVMPQVTAPESVMLGLEQSIKYLSEVIKLATE
jgi:hypothetical protein